MNLHKTIIREDLTKNKFGYSINELSNGSHNHIIVECSNCNRLIEREYRYAYKFHQCSVLRGNQKKCFKCNQWKLLEEFNKCPRATGGVSKMCRYCYNSHPSVIKCEKERLIKRKTIFKDNIELYITQRCYALKKQSKYKNLNFNLDKEYLINLWYNQDGKCYYSRLPMNSNGRDFGYQRWESPSIDRKNPDLGYIKDNVVWCCFGLNSFKQRFNEEQFKNIIKSIKWWYE